MLSELLQIAQYIFISLIVNHNNLLNIFYVNYSTGYIIYIV